MDYGKAGVDNSEMAAARDICLETWLQQGLKLNVVET
jgi:hypothetical protein